MRLGFYHFLFLIPGIGITVISVYFPLSYLHKQLFWTQTEAVITGVERAEYDDAYYVMEFTDTKGAVYEIHEYYDNDFSQGKDDRHALILYDPENPERNEVKNPGKFILVLFFPFGLLCSYLGWPRKDEKRKQARGNMSGLHKVQQLKD